MLSITGFKSNVVDLIDSNKRLVLAFSGGLDSSVLMHLLASCIDHKRLFIWHINHQLQDSAIKMEQFCLLQAKQNQLPFKVSRLNLSHIVNNVEAQARDARYEAFANEINFDTDILLTAHHADDQLETILLNMFRGSGVSGLRGIGRHVVIKGMLCHRPLLSYSRLDLEEYAKCHKVEWVEDPTNALKCYDRNYIRHDLAPLIKNRWPSVNQSFQQVSDHQKEAVECLIELALLDHDQCHSFNAFTSRSVLLISEIRGLSTVRQKNLMRYWLTKYEMVITIHQLNLLVNVLSSYEKEFKQVQIKNGFIAFFNNELLCVKMSDIRTEDEVKESLEKQEGYCVCRYNKKEKGVSSHFFKRQFQSKKIPPWLRDQTMFRLNDGHSKHIVETIVL